MNLGPQRPVLESLIQLGRTLGVQVVAQVVESHAQMDALCRMGCELVQGQFPSSALEQSEAFKPARFGYRALAPGA